MSEAYINTLDIGRAVWCEECRDFQYQPIIEVVLEIHG